METLIAILLGVMIIESTIMAWYNFMVTGRNTAVSEKRIADLEASVKNKEEENKNVNYALARLCEKRVVGFAITDRGIEPLPEGWRELVRGTVSPKPPGETI